MNKAFNFSFHSSTTLLYYKDNNYEQKYILKTSIFNFCGSMLPGFADFNAKNNKKKGGRPPTGRVRKLSKSVTVKFSKPSYEALRLRARKANRKLAEYIRESALNGEVVSGHNTETVAVAKNLIGMANNLNQLAKLSHQASQHGQSTLSYRI